MTKIWRRLFVFPLTSAMLLGLIAGYCEAKDVILAHNYWGFGLYNTALGLWVPRADHLTLFFSLLLYALCLLLVIYARLPDTARKACRLLAVIGLVVSAAFRFHLTKVISEIRNGLSLLNLGDYVFSSLPQIALAVIVVVAGLIYLLRARGKAVPEIVEDVGRHSTSSLPEMLGQLNNVRAPFVVVGTIFIIVNLAFGISRTSLCLSQQNRPNVILIQVDTLRADCVGCYGGPRNLTPNIDQLAKHSLRFSRAISQASWTVPSVCSFLTSAYPQQLFPIDHHEENEGLVTMHAFWGLGNRRVTIPEALKDQGYTTGAVVSNELVRDCTNWDRGFDFTDTASCNKKVSSPYVLQTSEKWINFNKDKRLFLFALFMDPHSPYIKHPGYDRDPGYHGPQANHVNFQDTEGIVGRAPCDVSHIKAVYDSEVAFTDHHVGLLLDYLKKQGLYDNSLIIFLGDHGEELSDHGKFFHGHSLYQELLSVPFIVKLPHQTEGRVVEGTYSLIDLFPTIMKSLGVKSSRMGLQGKAVDLSGVREMRDDYIFSYTRMLKGHDLRSVENSKYKYILAMPGSGSDSLFDLKKDPQEMHNILKMEPRIAAGLRKMVQDKETMLTPSENISTPPAASAPKPETKERLRSLGYAQ